MSASISETPSGAASHPKTGLSWKNATLLGAILFGGILCLSLLVQEVILGNYANPPAIVKSTDPDYRLQLLERAVSRYPGDAGGWLQLGHAYSEFGRKEDAAGIYENYLTTNPGNSDIWTELGIQYMQTDRPDKALEAFDQAIALNPKHEGARLNKGVVLLKAFNDLRGAIRSWMQVTGANNEASAPEGTQIEEWIQYCIPASEAKASGTLTSFENQELEFPPTNKEPYPSAM